MRLQQVISISVVALAAALQVNGQDAGGGLLPILDLGPESTADGAAGTTPVDPGVTEVPPVEGDTTADGGGSITEGVPQPTDATLPTDVPSEEAPPSDPTSDEQPPESSADNTEAPSETNVPSEPSVPTESSVETTQETTPEESTTPTEATSTEETSTEETSTDETSETPTAESTTSETSATSSETATSEETHTPSAKPAEERSGSGGLSGGAIAGIVVAAVVVVAALIGFLLWRRYRNRKAFVDNAFDYNEFPEYDPGHGSNANIADNPTPVGYTDKSLGHEQQQPNITSDSPGVQRQGDNVFDVSPHHHTINARDLDEA
ncbi:hypothetical protein H4R24_003387 [Coemansia sp. RSA 988]|nr:hypothetical protein H4R24_003387 [Coemansia sp. RSA 988]